MSVTPEDVKRAIDSGASQAEIQALVDQLATNPPPSRPVLNPLLRFGAETGGISDNIRGGGGGISGSSGSGL